MVWRTLSVKNTALARRNGLSSVRPVETPRGRMCGKRHRPCKQNISPYVLSRGGYEYLEQKLMAEKTKKILEEAAQSGSTEGIIDPLSPIRQHPDVVPVAITDPITETSLPPEPEVGPSAARVSTKGSCVDPSSTVLETGDSNKCGLYIEDNPSRLVTLGRVYEGSTAVHNIPLLHGQVKVGVEEVKDAEAPVPIPTHEVILVGQLFLKPLQVMWDATVFGVFNQDFPLYIKHEDLYEIAHADTSKWSSFCLRKTLLFGFVPCITSQTTTLRVCLDGGI
ncbi:hypothetical protein GmHk_01G001722 [Glycine max]|nr:hypothetical protein GmHk_01G001722 [Glycine max]